MVLRYLLCALTGYLLGSLNFGIIVSKLLYKKDVRNYGSKNAGMTNTARTFGKNAGALVFTGDFIKPVAACYIAIFLISGGKNIMTCGYIAGLATIIGHVFPVFFGFKGGKGVATMFGMALALCPCAAVIMSIPFFACLLISKTVSLSSIIASLFFPVSTFLIYKYFAFLCPGAFVAKPLFAGVIALAASLIVIFMHRTNIRRILKGEERKIGKNAKREK